MRNFRKYYEEEKNLDDDVKDMSDDMVEDDLDEEEDEDIDGEDELDDVEEEGEEELEEDEDYDDDNESEEEEEEGIGEDLTRELLEGIDSTHSHLLSCETLLFSLKKGIIKKAGSDDLYALIEYLPEGVVEYLQSINDILSSLYDVRESVIDLYLKIKEDSEQTK